jgi:5-(aminomethyl)-3-furanmethanol phosphate kinase
MVLGDPGIAASWDITSDSLAAWLAGKLRARRLVLVKSVAFAGDGVTAAHLARRGIVDRAFPDYFARCGAEGWCVQDAAYREMAAALEDMRGPGVQIMLDRAVPHRLPLPAGMLTSRADRSRTRRQ